MVLDADVYFYGPDFILKRREVLAGPSQVYLIGAESMQRPMATLVGRSVTLNQPSRKIAKMASLWSAKFLN